MYITGLKLCDQVTYRTYKQREFDRYASLCNSYHVINFLDFNSETPYHFFEERAVHKHTNTRKRGNIILNKGLRMFLDKYSCQVPRAWYTVQIIM